MTFAIFCFIVTEFILEQQELKLKKNSKSRKKRKQNTDEEEGKSCSCLFIFLLFSLKYHFKNIGSSVFPICTSLSV